MGKHILLLFLLSMGLCLAPRASATVVQAASDTVVVAEAAVTSAPAQTAAADEEPEADKPERCRECLRAKILWAIGVALVLIVGIFVL